MLTTIVFTLFVYPCTNNLGQLTGVQQRMLERMQKMFPYLWDDICDYPGVIPQMQRCKNIPYNFGIYCMKKWKEDGAKEQEVGEFIRNGEFLEENLSVKEQNREHLLEMISFMENYTKESRIWQESYAFRLIHELPYNIPILDSRNKNYISKEENFINYHKEQLEKLEKNGINLLENFFKFKNKEKNWKRQDSDKIDAFLEVWGEKENSLKVEELEKYARQVGEGRELGIVLDRCLIEIQDKSKLYFFQIVIGLHCSEEDMVKYYRKNLLPKEMIHKLIIQLRKAKKIEKIPLLLQWMYEEEEYVYS